MHQLTGDLWALHARGHTVLIPVTGDLTRHGAAIMGSGHAAIAAGRFPQLPAQLGERLSRSGSHAYAWQEYRVITFPTGEGSQRPATPDFVRRTAQETARFMAQLNVSELYTAPFPSSMIALPWADMLHILDEVLSQHLFVVSPAG